jgi:opacity protein-like surface antigen
LPDTALPVILQEDSSNIGDVMRSPATKFFLLIATIGLLFCATHTEARSQISVRLIGGVSQLGAYTVDGSLDDPTLLLGIGARYRLNNYHSFFLDIEQIERRSASAGGYEAYLTDFQLSREPLTAPGEDPSPYWLITLGYQFDFSDASRHVITPHIAVGSSLVRFSHDVANDPWYFDPYYSWNEKIESDETGSAWKIGATLGLGCSVRVSSTIGVSLDARFRNLGIGDPKPTILGGKRVFEYYPRQTNDGYEGELTLEFRL